MKHKRLIIATTILVFTMVCALSLKELFKVQDITVEYLVSSTEASEDVLVLLDKYKGKSIFSIDEQKIIDEITANRYLKVNSVEKKYPNELVINLSERIEKYYYISEDSKVYFFDEEFFVVRSSDNLANEEQILTQICFEHIEGQTIYPSCELKSTFVFTNQKNADLSLIMSEASSVSEQIKKITFVFTPEAGNYYIRIMMQEGATIEIRKAGESLAEKVNVGVSYYLSLEEKRKIDGAVIVQKAEGGAINAHHTYKP